jgi:hypothetical protein
MRHIHRMLRLRHKFLTAAVSCVLSPYKAFDRANCLAALCGSTERRLIKAAMS